MAEGREHTPEERYELLGEARTFAQGATAPADAPQVPDGSSADGLIASLATHSDVDAIRPTGSWRGVKQRILGLSRVFLREQAAFNRLNVTVLEDLTSRLDTAESRLAALEAKGASRPGPEA